MTVSAQWVAAAIFIPALIASISLIGTRFRLEKRATFQAWLAVIGVTANLVIALLLVTTTLGGTRLVYQMGLYQAPFGITLVADGLSTIMLTLTAILALTTVIYAVGTLDARRFLNFYPLLLFLVTGVNGAFLTGDIFNLYVFFEVLLVASFALLTLGGRIGQINGGIRYMILNLLASALFVTTAGIIYGTVGTLNMAQIAQRLPEAPQSVQLTIAVLLLLAFSSKAGLFPLFFWLPASYHTPHPAVTAFFGGLLTKVGIYTLFRVFPLFFPTIFNDWQTLILAVAGLTMLTGVFGAMAVNTVRRVLSFHIISQVGYMVMGLGLAASADPAVAAFGMAAGILYLVHHMIVKTALLMAGGAAELLAGSGSLLRNKLSGIRQISPALAVIFFIACMSLAGMPPSSGFVSKLTLLQGAISSSHWIIAAVSLLVSFFTLMSMLRLWQTIFWGYPASESTTEKIPSRPISSRRRWATLSPIAVLIALSLAIGVLTGPVYQWSSIAAAQVLDREGYINAVGPTDTIEYIESKYAEGTVE